MSSSALDAKEVFAAIQRGLPNIATYLRVVLKREKLSEEAESLRMRYDTILASLEQGVFPSFQRRFSVEDDGGYFSGNRIRVSEIHDHPRVPVISHAGYLLRRDDKYRWHRSWCRVESRDMKFYIYEDNNEEALVKSFSVENTTPRFGSSTIPDCDKENCFTISGISHGMGGDPHASVAMTPEGETTSTLTASSPQMSDEIYFAAYSDADLHKWKEALHLLTSSRESGRISIEGGAWLSPAGHDSASTSSSNFSSNRESMISTTSSLLANNRISVRSDTLDRDHPVTDDFRAMSLTKQQQPLPSPPPMHGQEESVKPEEDDDNASGGTIYESIDNLVLQFEDTIRETAQAMGQIGQNMKSGGKKRKKKDRSLFRQTSFLSSLGKSNSKSKLISEKKAELEKGERFSGYLYKKNSNGSWKKKWCVLKGAIFGYYKSAETDSHGQEYVILGADIRTIEDPKRSFTFSLMCKGVPEMYFSSEDEDSLMEWFSKLAAASNAPDNTGFGEEWAALQEEQAMMDDPAKRYGGDSVYRVPRPLSMDGSVYDIPPARTGPPPAAPVPPGISAEAAIESGLYSVPRALLNASEEGAQQLPPPPPNPFDIYDIPRTSMSPDMEDEEGIYDVPLDILDFEIYDYPPDVMEFGLVGDPVDSGLDTTRNSTITVSSDYTVTTERASSAISEDSWSTSFSSLQPGMRPSMAFSMASSDDMQSPRNSMISMDTSVFNYPRSNVSSEYIPSPMPPPVDNSTSGSREMLAHGTMTPDLESPMNDTTPLEYGQCQMRGNLYKRERFMTWTKLYCTIRNNFLECHKSSGNHYTPMLKLFLPGSEIKEGGGDAKKKWALQVKHPRRDGVLTFATDSRENLDRWIRAFQAGSSIEVQSVHTVEQIRITDLDMQKKFVSLEANALIDHTPSPSPMMDDFSTSTMPRRKTFSHQDEYQSDTLKRRRKFSWVKSGLMKRKGKKTESGGGSQGNLKQPRISQMSFDIQSPTPDMLPPYPADPMRKSVSLELLPSAPEAEESPARVCEAHESVNSEGKEQFQGYLRVQRKGADSMWVRYWCLLEEKVISCYISRRDFTLALSIPLKGSRITEATIECKRDHSFKVWHIESGQCLFFAAENADELLKWFNHITQGAEHTIPDNVSVGSNSGPFIGFFYIPDDKQVVEHTNSTSRLNDLAVNVAADDQTQQPAITVQAPSPSSVFYRGKLKKLAHTGKWKDRYCVIKSGHLNIYHSASEKSPITSIALQGCSLELLSVQAGSEHQYLFKLNPQGGSKSHTFAAPNETEMFAWVSALRDSSQEKPASPELRSQTSAENGTGSGGSSNSSPALSGKNTLKRKSKKLKDANLVSYVPASSLKNPEHCGFIEIQFISEPWIRYWCVSHSDNCLYIYEDQSSEATVKTICLPGYELKVIDPQVSKRPYTISISHTGISPVLLAANDQADLNMWLFVLERGTKAEFTAKSSKKVASTSKILFSDTGNVKVLSHKVSSKSGAAAKKKGPMKADHTIGTVKASEEAGGSADSSPTSVTGKSENPKAQQDAIIKRYEKRIRKTRKVASQTDERLKQQQTALLHFKKELSRHIVKLVELANGGDPQATKRLKNIRVKLQQLDKIVPYLSKYITVNRQAEMQTVAVLKESCTMELRQLTSGGRSPAKEALKPSPRGHRGTSPLSKSLKTEGIKEEEDENLEQQDEEERLADSAVVVKENGEAAMATNGDHRNGVEGEGVAASVVVVAREEENPYASLSEIRNQSAEAERKPTSNYAELHFSQSGGAAKVRPPSVNYSEVKINPSGRNMILTPDTVAQLYEEDRQMEQQCSTIVEESPDCSSVQDTTLTPESAALEASTSSLSSHSPRRPLSPVPPPSHPAPPPPTDDSPVHHQNHQPPCPPSPPISPIAHDGSFSKGNGQIELETSTVAVAKVSSPLVTQAQSTTVTTELRRAEAKAKSPPPPVAKKPTSKQSTPVHKANTNSDLTHSSPSHNGLEEGQSGDLNRSPTHRDVMSVMDGAPSLMDRIKALQKK